MPPIRRQQLTSTNTLGNCDHHGVDKAEAQIAKRYHQGMRSGKVSEFVLDNIELPITNTSHERNFGVC